MKRAPEQKQSRKKDLVQRWEDIVDLYQKALNSFEAKYWVEVIWELWKILFSICMKKVIEYFLN